MKDKRHKFAVAAALAAIIIAPLGWIWMMAPADPVYHGVRLSNHLYRTYGAGALVNGVDDATRQDCQDALKHLGPKAGPLLTAWIENRPSKIRDKLRDLLLKRRINWPYLTADRQEIVERLIFTAPEAAVPLAEAFQWQILNGPPKDAMRSASLLMFVINSVDAPSGEFIAARSTNLVAQLLDRFEKTNEDTYPLALVGPMIGNFPGQVTPEFRERVLALSKKSRFLDSAATVVKPL